MGSWVRILPLPPNSNMPQVLEERVFVVYYEPEECVTAIVEKIINNTTPEFYLAVRKANPNNGIVSESFALSLKDFAEKYDRNIAALRTNTGWMNFVNNDGETILTIPHVHRERVIEIFESIFQSKMMKDL